MKRELYFKNMQTGETDRRVDVTGKTERQIEKIERGMLINVHDDWCVCDTATDEPQ